MDQPPTPPQQLTGYASPDPVQTSRRTIERSRSLINGVQAAVSGSHHRIEHSRQRVHRSRRLLGLTPEPHPAPEPRPDLAPDEDRTSADEPGEPRP
ncbi:hypothetical protein GPA10_10860 [Streptomyces sp. p1417]|uniref:Uncharacterized protein n=1 Tax=Streptomyces typhae TaxID=2681492 RepID=A0A6L6WSW9_9ACTN|nr:hypothetical protein [Streptomyces typhae]MVO85240.1 hypothetical protein [Streptomyces typhae]